MTSQTRSTIRHCASAVAWMVAKRREEDRTVGGSLRGVQERCSPARAGSRSPDSEKITVNLGFIDLGRVDLMVRDGFYANRADFIRTAIRNQLERQEEAVRQSVARRQLKLGLSHYTRQDLEAAREFWDTAPPPDSRPC
jgi:Arc/MetJ-type ribon-helix-helix transcriptional regulator